MVRIIERVKCEYCSVTFGRTKTGRAWLIKQALHRARKHGTDFEAELDQIT